MSAPDSLRHAFRDPDSFATTLLAAYLDLYVGSDPDDDPMGCLDWSPETIRQELKQDLGLDLSRLAMDRLLTGIRLMTQDGFFTSLPDFIEICNVLAGSPASPGVFDPATALECAWGIAEATLLLGPDTEDPFSQEIKDYIAAALAAEGIIRPPDALRLADLSELQDKAQYGFTEDPLIFGAVWDLESAKTQEINVLVQSSLRSMLDQLGALRLRQGDTLRVVAKMLRRLDETERSRDLTTPS